MSRKQIINSKKILIRFGEAVRIARKDRGMSQEKLALDTRLDLTTINEIERGHRSPMLTTVCKIASGLGVKPAQLLQNL
jgi:transcriptional regulator with XRE-family HTH domain